MWRRFFLINIGVVGNHASFSPLVGLNGVSFSYQGVLSKMFDDHYVEAEHVAMSCDAEYAQTDGRTNDAPHTASPPPPPT